MIELGRHGGFILASYGAAVVILGALIALTVLRFRAARRRLQGLERQERAP
jgi:heme exporter protein CcmD